MSEEKLARPPFLPAYPSVTTTSPQVFWRRIRKADILLVFCIIIMLVSPWVFLGVIWHRKGIQASNSLSKVVRDHPSSTNFFLTFLGTGVRLVVGYLFSKAVLRFCQEWMVDHPLNIFHVSVISGLMNQRNPWGIEDSRYVFAPSRRLRVLLVVLCWATFIVVPSSTTSLLGPVPFNKTAPLTAHELDLSSNATDCLDWLENNLIPNQCDWETKDGANYTTCLTQNQLIDVLESGRGNILSILTNNSQSIDFAQLGATSGLHFLGPIRGVLPMGPNGVPGPDFNTLMQSPLSYPHTLAGMLSYNYTLYQQGLNSSVSCEYTGTQSPINIISPVPGDSSNLVVQYNGTCDGQADVLTNVTQFVTLNSYNGLTFWACKSPPSQQEPSYFIYLQGWGVYAWNMTCTISPIQPAIFPLTYHSTLDSFSLTKPVVVAPTTFSGLVDQSVVALGGLVEEAQSQQVNLVAEAVISFGAKYFQLSETGQNPTYLRLYEQMIQGIMEYLATYTRLLVSTGLDRPASCNRPVNGTLSYTVMGWSATPAHVGYLMPITIVNIASLIIMVLAILRTKSGSYGSDPLHPKILASAKHHFDKNDPTGGWKVWLTYPGGIPEPSP